MQSCFYFLLAYAQFNNFDLTSGCHKKKLTDGVCPTCQGDVSVWTYRAKVSASRNEEDKDVTLFEGDLTKLFGKFDKQSDDDILMKMITKLPVSFTAKNIGTKLYNIQKI